MLNITPLLDAPATVTTTYPVVPPLGTVTPILVPLQLVTGAVVPLKLTVLDPCVDPKFAPVMVTAVPIAPEVGERLVMLGLSTVKFIPLLFTPLANTTTLPVVALLGTVTTMLVALQLVTVAGVPLKRTVPDPCVETKFPPVIVTAVPTPPEVTDRLVMLGAGTTVKRDPLLLSPTSTTTFPVAAVFGTVTTRLVGLQLVTGAGYPSNLTTLFL
jgi:hypothetical protein